MNEPGEPLVPPGTMTAAVTGVLEVTLIAAGTPPSEGSETSAADPPGMSMPPAPVGS